MEVVFTSAAIVAIAEIGDKTQLLAIVLAARFRQPLTIASGILVATLVNHAAAASAGRFVAQWLAGPLFQVALGVSFVAMAVWALIPDKADERAASDAAGGVFVTTLVMFFLVEIGDKTQIATTMLAARFGDIVLVTLGTTFGMMAVNVPAVFFGEAVTKVAPLHIVRWTAACLFALIGVWVIASALLSA